MRPETAQDQHDEMISQNIARLKSRRRFEAVMAEVADRASMPPTAFDPLEQAMRDNPGLTREAAEEMARAFGF